MPFPLAVVVGAALVGKVAGALWLWRRSQQETEPATQASFDPDMRRVFIQDYPYDHVAGEPLRQTLAATYKLSGDQLEVAAQKAWAGFIDYLTLHIDPPADDAGPLGVPAALVDDAWQAMRNTPQYDVFCRLGLGRAFPMSQAPWNRRGQDREALARTARWSRDPSQPMARPFLFTLNDGLPGERPWNDRSYRQLILRDSVSS